MDRQALSDKTGGDQATDRLQALRAELKRRRLGGFVVPRCDEHQGETVPLNAERLAWLTGFTGSAGLAVVLTARAAVFVDGRYTLQAEAEVDGAWFEIRHSAEAPHGPWISANLPAKARLGYDPWLHTPAQVTALGAACEEAGARLVACPENPIDAVWTDRPPPPMAPVVAHDRTFAGEESSTKRRRLAAFLVEHGVDAAVLSAPDSIAWLLNVRGGDVPFAPLPLSFAVLNADARVDLLIDGRKLTPGLADHLGKDIRIRDREALGGVLDELGKAGRTVRLDEDGAPAWIAQRLEKAGARMAPGADPCVLAKARKNPVEMDGMRAAHRRDGAALSRFLAWLERHGIPSGVTELAAAERLEAFRREGELFRGLSFPTISGAGAHGAIVHYRVSADTDRRLESGSLYLLDSGAQYADGTTDVTRTIAVGAPSAEMRDRFTRVLKGHIAIATARFPAGTAGSQLDGLARKALWEVGLDYDHGTGHGVGSYLCVHEGPQRISKKAGGVPLEPGMVVSNEPGYYKAGAYGIRIENLVAVISLEAVAGGEQELLGFETLTLAPIDRRLIDTALLDEPERAWLDAYHRRVAEEISPRLDTADARWLAAATRPID